MTSHADHVCFGGRPTPADPKRMIDYARAQTFGSVVRGRSTGTLRARMQNAPAAPVWADSFRGSSGGTGRSTPWRPSARGNSRSAAREGPTAFA
jgi:hypothetical protein